MLGISSTKMMTFKLILSILIQAAHTELPASSCSPTPTDAHTGNTRTHTHTHACVLILCPFCSCSECTGVPSVLDFVHYSGRARDTLKKVKEFMTEHVYPKEMVSQESW